MENGPIQVNASTVQEAVELGLTRLGLKHDDVTVEVVDEGSRGILGLGARDALVRLKPVGTLPDKEPIRQPQPTPELAEHPEQESDDEYALSQEQVAEIARQTLSELLGKMGIEGQVVLGQSESREEDETSPITLDILGDNLNVLIGRQGQVLDSLQYITRLIVSREVEHWVNLLVDVDRYKQRRANSLRKLAERLAERVAQTKQPVALEPMPPNERRVIHITLRSHPTVTTQSVGKGDSRKVTIIPKG